MWIKFWCFWKKLLLLFKNMFLRADKLVKEHSYLCFFFILKFGRFFLSYHLISPSVIVCCFLWLLLVLWFVGCFLFVCFWFTVELELQYQKKVLINSKFKTLISLSNFISCFQLIEKEDGHFPCQFPPKIFNILLNSYIFCWVK